ncbi:MAG TPA: HAD family acid phosphatase [Thermoanaerobaculia bacterium]
MRRLIPLLLVFAGCATTPTTPAPTPATTTASAPCNPGHTILNATLWVQSSAEFRAASTQTFAAARRALDEALADRTRTGATEETNADPDQPPAIVTDVDETVLDNTPFEARVIQAGKTYDSASWKEWTAEGAAPPMPGATEFLQYAKSRGVTVFYVTNRDEDERPGTRANLERAGFPLDPNVETLLLRSTTSDKSPRRKHVADRYRLLLLLGDDFNDFANVREASWDVRDALVKEKESWWGTRWFMLPNPMYGSWERAAIGSGGTPCEQAERKVRALKR